MFCMKCGCQNANGSAFCARCGSPMWNGEHVDAPVAEPVKEAETADWASINQTPLDETPVAPSETEPVMPPASETVAPPQPKKAKAPKAKRAPKSPPPRPTAGVKLLSVFLIICFCFNFILASSVGLVQSLISEETIAKLINKIELDEEIIGSFVKTEDGEEIKDLDDLSEYIYNNLSDDMKEILSERTISNILESDLAGELIGDIAMNYIGTITGDSDAEEVDADYIVALLSENIDDLTDGEIDHLNRDQERNLEKNLEKVIDFSEISENPLGEQFDGLMAVVRFVLSPLCYYMLIALCVIFLILIILAGRKNICACVRRLFITFVVLGVLYLISTLAALCFMFIPLPDILTFITPLFSTMTVFYALRGGILFVVGLAGCIISGKVRDKERARAASYI